MQDPKVLHRAFLEGNAKTATQTTEQALATGVEPLKLVQDYMIPAMAEVGHRFETNSARNFLVGPETWLK